MPTGIYIRKKRTEEWCKNISRAKMGNSYSLGHRHSKETIDKIRMKHIGKRHTNETKEKLRLINSGIKRKPFSKKWRENLSRAAKGRKLTKEWKERISASHLGKISSDETKRKQRLHSIKRIEENYGICFPGYNKTACEYFRLYDEAHNTKGRYAVCGGGEYQVRQLGYFLDYINFDLKLIIEWDEPRHYDENGKLRKKCKVRQAEIQALFPDFEFRRIKEDNKVLNCPNCGNTIMYNSAKLEEPIVTCSKCKAEVCLVQV